VKNEILFIPNCVLLAVLLASDGCVEISCIWAKATSYVLLTATSVGEEFLSAWMCEVYTFSSFSLVW